MICAQCGTEHQSKYCPECGTAAGVSCSGCGNYHTAKFCPECGTPAAAPAPMATAPSGVPELTLEPAPQPPAWPEPPPYEGAAPTQPQPMPEIITVEHTYPMPEAPAYPPTQHTYPQPPPQPQVQPGYQNPTIIINNQNTNTAVSTNTNTSYNVSTTPAYQMSSPKSKVVALLLCLFLGVLGVHRFYVGKVGTGLLYLFTGAIGGIGWLIDLLMIIFGNFTDSAGQRLET